MGWYDLFSSFYDASLASIYAQARRDAVEALHLRPGDLVLDVPCGTGLSFDALAPAVGPQGRIVGVDRSRGMLAKAKARAAKAGFDQVRCHQADVHAVDAAFLEAAAGRPDCDGLLVFLGLTAFDGWTEALQTLTQRVRDGGRCVIVDVYAQDPGLQGKMVNLVARADIRRRVWEPLEAMTADFERRLLPPRKEYGGELFIASGTISRSDPG